jgi:hypothetical protein
MPKKRIIYLIFKYYYSIVLNMNRKLKFLMLFFFGINKLNVYTEVSNPTFFLNFLKDNKKYSEKKEMFEQEIRKENKNDAPILKQILFVAHPDDFVQQAKNKNDSIQKELNKIKTLYYKIKTFFGFFPNFIKNVSNYEEYITQSEKNFITKEAITREEYQNYLTAIWYNFIIQTALKVQKNFKDIKETKDEKRKEKIKKDNQKNIEIIRKYISDLESISDQYRDINLEIWVQLIVTDNEVQGIESLKAELKKDLESMVNKKVPSKKTTWIMLLAAFLIVIVGLIILYSNDIKNGQE